MNKILLILLLFCLKIDSQVTAKKYDFEITFNDTDVENDVRFFLYTRINAENPEQLWVGDKEALDNSMYDSSKATKFMTHGWLNTYQGLNCKTVRKAFLAHDDYNVIVVDWGNVAKLPYLVAASLVKAVGGRIEKMVSFLESQGSNPNNVSLVGHSLGAQVMGLAGYQANNKVGHIVALDPAAPGFDTAGPGRGISSEDAKLVEIVHTNAGDMGLKRPAGHIDFYPNGGGMEQPGCGEDLNHYCAHDRAYIYYAEALTRPDGLLAVFCKDYETFLKGECDENNVTNFPSWTGEGKTARGSYFLRTAEKSPFGLGLNGTKAVKETDTTQDNASELK